MLLRITTVLLLIALTLVAIRPAFAMQPPPPGDREVFRQDGTLPNRLNFAARIGDDQFRPSLLQQKMGQFGNPGGVNLFNISRIFPYNTGLPSSGSPKVVALLIEFPDHPHTVSASTFTSQLFGSGSSSEYPYESVKNFYSRSSYGKLNIQGNVLGWYMAQNERSYYGDGGSILSFAGVKELIKEALDNLSATHDFSQYDNDGDGMIDYLLVFWTGPDTGWSSLWWAWNNMNGSIFSGDSYKVDGKSIGVFSWIWEKKTGYPTALTAIHETGHALGIPDYYDYDDTAGPKGGVGGLDIMDGNRGDHNCFSKWLLDWLNPAIVGLGDGVHRYTLHNSAAYGECVAIMPAMTASPFREFFMVQNRSRLGNDSNIYTDGLLIWHVDGITSGGNFDFNNSSTSHKILRLMEADGLEEIETGFSANAGDFYVPGKTFTDLTMPSSRNYGGSATNVNVQNITSGAGTYAADFSIASLVNGAPDAVDDSATTRTNTAVRINVLVNDTDPDGDALSITGTSAPANGTVNVDSGLSIIYTPNSGFEGTNTFTYIVTDGHGHTDNATVTVTVAAAGTSPLALDDFFTKVEDSGAQVLDVMSNDLLDATSHACTITGVSPARHGTVVNNTTNVTYTPAANYNGLDFFTYTIADTDGDSDVGCVMVNVTSVNDPPVAQNDSVTLAEDTPTTINVLANDTDVDNDSLSVTNFPTPPSHGGVTVNFDQTVLYTPTLNYSGPDSFVYTVSDGHGGTANATVTVTVTPVEDPPVAGDTYVTCAEDTFADPVRVLDNCSDAEGDAITLTGCGTPQHGTATINVDGITVRYVPAANFFGSDQFTFTIRDAKGDNATGTVYVTVTNVQDPPVAQDDYFTTKEDTAKDCTVLDNDTDVDNDTLTVQSVTVPAHGTAVINSGGTTVRYTPAVNYHGSDTFDYTMNDGHGNTDTATVHITVTTVNDPPTAVDDNAVTPENTPLEIAVLANDTDPEGDNLTIVGLNRGSHGTVAATVNNTVRYTPDTGYAGADTFIYTISDGNGGKASARVHVTINPVAQPPVVRITGPANRQNFLVGEEVIINADATDDGVVTRVDFYEGTTLLGSANLPPYIYRCSNLLVGSYVFSAVAVDNDGTTGTSNLVHITVSNSPEFAPQVRITSPPNNTTYTTSDNITFTADASVKNGTISKVEYYNGATKLGTVTTSPYALVWSNVPVGQYAITARAYDSNGAFSTSYPVGILVNTLPVARPDNVTIPEDTEVEIDVLRNDNDTDGDVITLDNVSQPTHGSVMIVTNGMIRYTPDFNFNGTDQFTYSIRDIHCGKAAALVTVTVTPVADPPTVRITSPIKNTSFAAGRDVTIQAEAADSDGSVSKVEFYQGITLLGTADHSPFEFTWKGVPAGYYFLMAKATDNEGNVVTSSAVPIHILGGSQGQTTQNGDNGTSSTDNSTSSSNGGSGEVIPAVGGCGGLALIVLGLLLFGGYLLGLPAYRD
jgi:M6 family metalloprotease-like protein